MAFEFIWRIHRLPRVLESSSKVQDGSISEELRKLFGDGPDGIKKRIKGQLAGLPGPLEGGTSPAVPLPREVMDQLKQIEGGGVIDSNALAGIINLGLVFQVTPEHAEMIVKALRASEYHVEVEGSKDRVSAMLLGLAIIASVTRQPALAQEVRVLARVMRHRYGQSLDGDDLFRIALIASSSHQDLKNWCELIGDWLYEWAMQPIDRDGARRLLSYLRVMCQLEPALLRYCGRAEASLAAVAKMAA